MLYRILDLTTGSLLYSTDTINDQGIIVKAKPQTFSSIEQAEEAINARMAFLKKIEGILGRYYGNHKSFPVKHIVREFYEIIEIEENE